MILTHNGLKSTLIDYFKGMIKRHEIYDKYATF